VVYLGAGVAERLLSCHVLPPLDSCTYLGLDSGATPICVGFVFIFCGLKCCVNASLSHKLLLLILVSDLRACGVAFDVNNCNRLPAAGALPVFCQ